MVPKIMEERLPQLDVLCNQVRLPMLGMNCILLSHWNKGPPKH